MAIRPFEVRKLNDRGLARFEEFLARVRSTRGGSHEEPPYGILNDDDYSSPIKLSGYIKKPKRINIYQDFEDRMDFADHLCSFIKTDEDVSMVINDKFAGAWLALAYFRQICAKDVDGNWNIRANSSYVPEIENRERFYRHLVCSVIAVYHLHGKMGRLVLSGPTHQHPDFLEQLAGRTELMINKSLLRALDTLYWDSDRNAPKVGAVDTKRPAPDGVLRRFAGPGGFYQIYKTTFDFWSMEPEQIIELLPSEFDDWLE